MATQATHRQGMTRTGQVADNCPEAEVAAKGKPDRRVEKTKRALLNALVQVMIEKGYEECSVADIVERANVGRSTFYAHYADKEDLLKESFAGLMAHLREVSITSERGPHPVHPALGFVRPMLEHLQEMRTLFKALAARPTSATVQRHLHLLLSDLVQERLESSNVRVPASRSFVAELIVGAFLATCFWWMNEREQVTIEQVEKTFCSMLTPALMREEMPPSGPRVG